jgi:hypothetical protein
MKARPLPIGSELVKKLTCLLRHAEGRPESLRLKLLNEAGSMADMGVWGTPPDCHSVSIPAPLRSAKINDRTLLLLYKTRLNFCHQGVG